MGRVSHTGPQSGEQSGNEGWLEEKAGNYNRPNDGLIPTITLQKWLCKDDPLESSRRTHPYQSSI
ncbi:MAG: hypothetical protein AAFQ63_05565 [Cyanobacteria bacterium J06621_11]